MNNPKTNITVTFPNIDVSVDVHPVVFVFFMIGIATDVMTITATTNPIIVATMLGMILHPHVILIKVHHYKGGVYGYAVSNKM